MKLLIAEDSSAIAEGVAFGAGRARPGCMVSIAASSPAALALFSAE